MSVILNQGCKFEFLRHLKYTVATSLFWDKWSEWGPDAQVGKASQVIQTCSQSREPWMVINLILQIKNKAQTELNLRSHCWLAVLRLETVTWFFRETAVK